MSLSRHPQINEELLSAYLDNEVTEEERSLVEAAIAADPAIAWQTNSLRATIHLLQELPPLALPRSFAIEAIIADSQALEAVPTTEPTPLATRNRTAAARSSTAPQYNWWQWLQQIWQGGDLYLRNAAAVALTLLVVLFVSDQFIAPYQPSRPQSRTTVQIAANSSAVTANPAVAPLTETATDVVSDLGGDAADIASDSATVAATGSVTTLAIAKQAPAESGNQSDTESPAPTAALIIVPPRAPQEDTEALDGGGAGPAARFAQPEAAASLSDMRTTTDSGPRADMANSIQTQSAPSVASGEMAVTASSSHENENSTPTPAPLAPSAEVVTETVTATATLTVSITVTPPVTGSTVVTIVVTTVVTTVADHAPQLETVSARDEVTSEIDGSTSWLLWAQMITALVTVVLGALWWRSRG